LSPACDDTPREYQEPLVTAILAQGTATAVECVGAPGNAIETEVVDSIPRSTPGKAQLVRRAQRDPMVATTR
jgi:hypothetical protein